MKICPECINLNVNADTCSTCGYPLNKKVIGRFEDYYFYDAIELFNAGERLRAKEKISEKQKTENSSKNSLLLEKIESAETIISKAESNANLAEDYLRRKDFSLALDAIQSAIASFPSARYKNIEAQILKELEQSKKSGKALSLFNDAQQLFQNNSYASALSTLRQAMELDPYNQTFKDAYHTLSDQAAKVWCAEAGKLIGNKKFNEASVIINEALIYAGSNQELIELGQKVTKEINSKKNTRTTIVAIIVFIVLGVSVFGLLQWKKISDEKSLWELALQDGTIPALDDFIKLHPQSQHINEAQEKLAQLKISDSIEWHNALLRPSKSSINEYLSKANIIKGLYVTRAVEMIDSIDWFEIEKLDDAALFQDYVVSHPNSKYLADAQARLSLTVSESEKQDLYNMMVSYFNTYQQKDLETIMQYYNPITSVYGGYNNITKADLRLLFERDLSNVTEANYILDYATFKATKDSKGNYYLIFFSDINIIRSNNSDNIDLETESVFETKYFTNSQYTVVIDQMRKINKFTYKIISEQPIN
jgi:tetratricopeptide (TPR) repeat protein